MASGIAVGDLQQGHVRQQQGEVKRAEWSVSLPPDRMASSVAVGEWRGHEGAATSMRGLDIWVECIIDMPDRWRAVWPWESQDRCNQKKKGSDPANSQN